MNRTFQIALFCLFAAVSAFARSPVGYEPVSGSNLHDSSGNLEANITWKICTVNNLGIPISFLVNGQGQATKNTITEPVPNRGLSIQLVETALPILANGRHTVTARDDASGRNLLGPGYPCVQPPVSSAALTFSYRCCAAASGVFGGTCNFGSDTPNLVSTARVQTGPSQPAGPSGGTEDLAALVRVHVYGDTMSRPLRNPQPPQPGTSQPRSYFVDPAGSDSNDGLSPSTPLATIAKVNTLSLQPGQSVMFKRGGLWRASLNQTSSGTAASPITFGSYGTGPQPIISGADLVTGWTPQAITTPNYTASGKPSPVAWWFMEATSGTTESDGSAYGNDLVARARITPSATHRQGKYSFDAEGGSQYLAQKYSNLSPDFPGKTTNFTIGGWIYIPDVIANYQALLSFSDNSSRGFSVNSRTSDNSWCVNTFDSSSHSYFKCGGSILSSNWYHLDLTLTSLNVVTLYVNGVAVIQYRMATPLKPAASSDTFILGYGGGLYDEWYAFDSALTQSQILGIGAFGLAGGSYTAYKATLATRLSQLFVNGNRLQGVTSRNSLVLGSFWRDAADGLVYVRDSDDHSPATRTVEVSTRSTPVLVSASYQIYQDLEIDKSNYNDIEVISGVVQDGITIRRDTIMDSWADGVLVNNPKGANNISVLSNNITASGANGVALLYAGNNDLFQFNRICNNSQLSNLAVGGVFDQTFSGGMKVFGGGGTTDKIVNLIISNNEFCNNGPLNWVPPSVTGNGLWLDTVLIRSAVGPSVYGNIIHDNPSSGLCIEASSDVKVYNNLLYNDGTWPGASSLFLHSDQGYPVSNNNIFHNTIVSRSSYPVNLTMDGGTWVFSNNQFTHNLVDQVVAGRATLNVTGVDLSGYGNVIDDNCYGNETPFFVSGTNAYRSLTAWQAGSSQDAGSITAGPVFVGKFSQVSSSPCGFAGVPANAVIGSLGGPPRE